MVGCRVQVALARRWDWEVLIVGTWSVSVEMWGLLVLGRRKYFLGRDEGLGESNYYVDYGLWDERSPGGRVEGRDFENQSGCADCGHHASSGAI